VGLSETPWFGTGEGPGSCLTAETTDVCILQERGPDMTVEAAVTAFWEGHHSVLFCASPLPFCSNKVFHPHLSAAPSSSTLGAQWLAAACCRAG
jgi:hypothetical protein